ncbi:aquaporin family protein, partial [Fulvivirga sp. RKSG066]|uniref:MIP/aquaporin family protein n=1 Tax=Fulvivirga aurantia TaxID=2529383 RepID=UPI0012BC3D8A
MSIYLGEFIGTFILMLLGSGVVAGVLLNDSKAKDAGWLVIVVAWGLAVSFAIYAAGNISGAHINPAVTLSLAFVGDFEWSKVPGYLAAQILGAGLGSTLVWVHYLPHWKKSNDAGAKLAIFCTGPAIRSYASNLVSEMIGTMVLIMSILFIGANEFTEGLNPLVIGALIVVIGLSLGGTTGFAINPARDFGPRIAHFLLPIAGKGKSDWSYAWVPVVGPLLGGLLGGALYKMLFLQQYHWTYSIVI